MKRLSGTVSASQEVNMYIIGMIAITAVRKRNGDAKRILGK